MPKIVEQFWHLANQIPVAPNPAVWLATAVKGALCKKSVFIIFSMLDFTL